ncbi:MAG: hypothetical protein OEN50_19235, partial [Deltaproteobacteria bacterium]|nr:hypothetical protein [Deltaproteobacteria bacterium]
MKTIPIFLSFCVALVAMALLAPPVQAYPTYSAGTLTDSEGNESSVGYCQTCHGDFRDEDAAQLSDGEPWSVLYKEVENPPPPVEERGLHDVHRHVMVDKIGSSRCNVCHTRPPGFYPVLLGSSTGSDPLPGLGCVGCHG